MASIEINLGDDENIEQKTNHDGVAQIDVDFLESDGEESPKQKMSNQSILSIKSKSSTSTNDGHHTFKSHDRAKTILNITKIFEKGEQPKTDKYEVWAWYCYDCLVSITCLQIYILQ